MENHRLRISAKFCLQYQTQFSLRQLRRICDCSRPIRSAALPLYNAQRDLVERQQDYMTGDKVWLYYTRLYALSIADWDDLAQWVHSYLEELTSHDVGEHDPMELFEAAVVANSKAVQEAWRARREFMQQISNQSN